MIFRYSKSLESHSRRTVAVAVDEYLNFHRRFSENCIFQIGWHDISKTTEPISLEFLWYLIHS